jgi:hypothetical protein
MLRMNNKPDESNQYSPEETVRRRDEAIRRALNTPPKPQKEISGKSGRPPRKGLRPVKKQPQKQQTGPRPAQGSRRARGQARANKRITGPLLQRRGATYIDHRDRTSEQHRSLFCFDIDGQPIIRLWQ